MDICPEGLLKVVLSGPKHRTESVVQEKPFYGIYKYDASQNWTP